ncbi:hypothetical protein N7516_008562 [Penicillium verrucosum]|uniref:uncharacterized protein n=1 Tax=Penicillium verrucosum TaxID=60171 RepID=UPI002544FD4C|nr:uncharacterized protein N7516_008562 [Penicillium verrucosum]KAJ5926789.1 hypothetical protein N7516_008562 [Penicillium verrucosum]
MSNSMFNANNTSDIEADSEGRNLTPLPYGWRLLQLNNSSYADVMSSPLMYRAHSTLAPFPDVIPTLAPTPDYLSTGAPRLAVLWVRCCGCNNLVNPDLAPEYRCPICSHTECSSCGKENVP